MGDRTPSRIVVRPAVAEDAAALSRVHVASQQSGYAGIMPSDYLASLTWEQRLPVWQERLHAGQSALTLVAVDDATLVGFLHLAPATDDDVSPAVTWELVSIHIDPAHRSRGCGSRLLDAAIAALPADATTLVLWVLEDNDRARAFYERMGFAPDGRLRTAAVGGVDLRYLRYARRLAHREVASSDPSFPDHFSAVAGLYAESRPTYPEGLFTWLSAVTPEHALAWDCGTGSGQAAVGLAAHFARVIASDASPEQLAQGIPHLRVDYRCFPAERAELANGSVDLVTIAQALHWMDRTAFYREVDRVVRPGGVIAAWTYGKSLVPGAPEITEVTDDFHDRIVWPYWPPERSHVDSQYTEIEFPFDRLDVPRFEMRMEWDLNDLLAYLGSWSSVSAYRAQVREDPRQIIDGPLRERWGDPSQRRTVVWPLTVIAGTVPSIGDR